MSMDQLFKGHLNPDDDYYAIMGCSEWSSAEQILTEYRLRVLQYHPDKNPNDPSRNAKFLKLQIAKDTLINPTKRRDYDMWRNSGISISYKEWITMRGNSEPVFHWVTSSTPESRMLDSGHSQSLSENSDLHKKTSLQCEEMSRVDCSRDSVLWKFRNYEI